MQYSGSLAVANIGSTEWFKYPLKLSRYIEIKPKENVGYSSEEMFSYSFVQPYK